MAQASTWAELRAARRSRPETRGNVAVTNAAGGTRVLRHNPRRIGFVIVNNEANAAHMTRTPSPATTDGIRLDAAGGVVSSTLEEDGTVVQDEVWVILETAAGNIHVEAIEEA